jgi:hypothetical protein
VTNATTSLSSGGWPSASTATPSNTGPAGPECRPRPQTTRTDCQPRSAERTMNRHSCARAASARRPCRSQVDAMGGSPRASACRVARDTPATAAKMRPACRSTTMAVDFRSPRLSFARGRRASVLVGVCGILAGPGRSGRTSAYSRANRRRSSSASDGDGVGCGGGMRLDTMDDSARFVLRPRLLISPGGLPVASPPPAPFRPDRTPPRPMARSS